MSAVGGGVPTTTTMEDEQCSQELLYVSPIASPLVEGKSLKYSVKLIRHAVAVERAIRNNRKQQATPPSSAPPKCVKRGVQEVTKSLRKGEKGLVFFASDVFPVDIISHLPVLCEEKDVLYGYIGSKKYVGSACCSSRPASVLFVCQPGENHQLALKDGDGGEKSGKKRKAKDMLAEGEDAGKKKQTTEGKGGGVDVVVTYEEFDSLFQKTKKSVKKCNPYF
eukprot:GHVS01003387.1.p1 GENE.GHVS01003387.1~~GHVS01003387.1.p1  ORF type:complete len:222 (-),score=78.96 GHVS01003387.1:123-788(-)